MRQHRQKGFTLLEVLVALVVIGFLMAGLTQGTRFGLSALDNQQRVLDSQSDADAIDRVLRSLIEQADPGRATVAAGLSGTRGSLTLISHFPSLDRQRRDGDVTAALGVDAGHRLVLRTTPFIHATRLAPLPQGEELVLLTGIDHLEIAYWGRTAVGGNRAWQSQWSGAELPDLIRIQVMFEAGSQKRWPPMVAAPMRGKAG
jgi:general secretion pathway protein J